MFHSTLLKRHGNRKAYFIFYLEFNVEESFNLKLRELLYCKPRCDFLIIRTWVTSEIADLGPEQSLFITTNTKDQAPFMFNIGLYLGLGVFCLGCPLKTYIRKKTRLIPLKVTKIYFYDSSKPCPEPVPSNGEQTEKGFL